MADVLELMRQKIVAAEVAEQARAALRAWMRWQNAQQAFPGGQLPVVAGLLFEAELKQLIERCGALLEGPKEEDRAE